MHVLVPFDDSDPAREALEHAVTTYSAIDLTVLHVVEPSIVTDWRDNANDSDASFPITAEDMAVESVFEFVSTIADEHDITIATEVLLGSPSRAIVQFAEGNDVDWIVVGSHGRTGASRVLLGSVAEQVVRRAPVPVTVVR
ncbi:universal stress protein [Halostagnicola sp. A-GB9-2]|uniref:universal stress protein n=1 Tax=Halostagnicola sp. A-GB9-2 TaxID=3048066 RepID=UPI0024C08D1B|nr:universal stress protein [Halostagnicola sp. A-GB9-2]MDJ1434568.1 universal stress protein [Halostagnicola sp. A-GB9-2]